MVALSFKKFCSLWLKSAFNSNMILCLQIKQGSYTKRLGLLTRANVIILSILHCNVLVCIRNIVTLYQSYIIVLRGTTGQPLYGVSIF